MQQNVICKVFKNWFDSFTHIRLESVDVGICRRVLFRRTPFSTVGVVLGPMFPYGPNVFFHLSHIVDIVSNSSTIMTLDYFDCCGRNPTPPSYALYIFPVVYEYSLSTLLNLVHQMSAHSFLDVATTLTLLSQYVHSLLMNIYGWICIPHRCICFAVAISKESCVANVINLKGL